MRRLLPMVAVACALAACDKPQPAQPSAAKPAAVTAAAPPAPAFAALTVTADNWRKTKPKCRGEDCPFIEVELSRISDNPALAALVEKTLVSMVSIDEKQPVFNTLEQLSAYFWPKTQGQWNIYLQSKVLRQYKNLLVVQLDSDTYLGGAHGIGVTRYLNIDRTDNRVLTLADVLEPGKDGEFWQKVQALHADWLKANDLTDPDLTSVWPFIKTDNFALTEHGLTIKYQNYDIGAYAFGQPEFTVPYGQLKGIVKAIYL